MSYYENIMRRHRNGQNEMEIHRRRASIINRAAPRPGFDATKSYAERIQEYLGLCHAAGKRKIYAVRFSPSEQNQTK